MNRTKVLITSLGGGGAERQVSYIVNNNLVDEVIIMQDDCAYDVEKSKISYLFNKDFRLNSMGILKTLFFGPVALVKKLKDCDTLLSFLELSNFINIISKVFVSHNAIVSVRISPSFYDKKKLGFLYKFLMKLLYPSAELVITNSEACRLDILDMINIDPEKVKVVKNALDLDKIKELNSNSDEISVGKNTLVTVGRLSYQKNYEGLIQIIKKANKKNNLKLIILGDGDLRESLYDLCNEMGVSYSVEDLNKDVDVVFMGYQNNPYQFLTEKSIFVLASHYEGLPNVVLEAMSCGLPIISSDCKTGPREILSPSSNLRHVTSESEWAEFGVLLPVPRNHDHHRLWSETINKLVNDVDKRKEYGKQSILRSNDYSLDKIMNEWKKIIDIKKGAF